MSRHDKTIAKAKIARTPPEMQTAIKALTATLYEEIEAHDKTRASRNDAYAHVRSLLGNVRGLEAKICGPERITLPLTYVQALYNATLSLGGVLDDQLTEALIAEARMRLKDADNEEEKVQQEILRTIDPNWIP